VRAFNTAWDLVKRINHREIYLLPTLDAVDFSDEGEFRTPLKPCRIALRGCEGVEEVSGPIDPRKPNDNWISGCKSCYEKMQDKELMKMARHRIGPTEIWDEREHLYYQEGSPSREEWLTQRGLPLTWEKPGDRPEWWDEMDEEGNPKDSYLHGLDWEKEKVNPIYVPVGGSPTFGNYTHKVMMTPEEFLGLAYDTKREDLPFDHQLPAMAETFQQGIPMYLPHIIVQPTGEKKRFQQIGHEGRHRMQSLIDMGYGGVKVPVGVTTTSYFGEPYSVYGGNKEYLDALIYSIIRGQEDRDGNKKKFLVSPDDINPLWERGATEVIRE